MAARDSLSTAHAALGLAAGTPLVVYAGRLVEAKGLDVLVDCWPAVLAAHPQARLWLAGEGPFRTELDDRIARLGLRGYVLMPGVFDSATELFAAADLFVLPSRCEEISLALLDAMAHGLPSVVSDLPGNRSVLSENEHGLVVPAGDPPALATAILRLLNDRELAARVGQAAQQHARRSFPLDKMLNQHLQLFDELYK
jgi:glycosyltransferase involved in cell wall biosynthesis